MIIKEKLDLIKSVVKNFTDEQLENFNETTRFSDLNLDSLDIVEIQIALETKLGYEIPDPVDDKPINTVGDLLNIL